jgi:hypothetical protein
MTDVGDTTAHANDNVQGGVVANVVDVPITKVKGESVSVNFDELPLEVYKEMLFLGAKEYINKVGMSKIGAGLTKLEGTELDKAQKAVVAQAQKNADAMLPSETGGVKKDFKFSGTAKSATKVSGAVNTEAMRLAKNIVKDLMKKAGLKISHTPASEITSAAKEVLKSMPDLYKTAEANLEARAKTPTIAGLDIKSLVHADPALVAKADAAKAAKKKGPLSSKQAGMVAPKKKPTGASATTH